MEEDFTFSAEYARFIMPTADELKRERCIEDYAKGHNMFFIEAVREIEEKER